MAEIKTALMICFKKDQTHLNRNDDRDVNRALFSAGRLRSRAWFEVLEDNEVENCC